MDRQSIVAATRQTLTVIVMSAALTAGGCGAGNDPPVMTEAATPEQAQYEALWQASLDVLARYGFLVDRQDRWAGLITTEPLTGKSILEFWRRDAATTTDALESTFQTIYRTAEVRIRRHDDGTYYPVVRVAVGRSDRPERQFAGTGEAHAMFRESPRRRQRRALSDDPSPMPARPVPLGHDPALAERLASDILADAAQRQPH